MHHIRKLSEFKSISFENKLVSQYLSVEITMSKPENDYFTNPDGIKIYRLIFPSTLEDTKAVVFIAHGLFEHCRAAYDEEIIQPLADIGCLVITHDHMGHGCSEGERGMIYDFNSLVRDVLLDIDDVIKLKAIPSDTPIFIYGHSMGGLISIYAILEREGFFSGMCLEGPLVIYPTKFSKLRIWSGKMINFIFPSFPAGHISYEDICSDPINIKRLKNDNLRIHTAVPVKTAIQIYDAVVAVKDLLQNIEIPFIIGHGELDEICEIEGSKMLVELSKTRDKVLISFPNTKHQVRIEKNAALEFRTKVIDWMNSKINK